MKKALALIVAVLILAAIATSACGKGKGAPSDFAFDQALYVHAVNGSDDAQAWQKWQSEHDEDFIEEPEFPHLYDVT